MDRQDGPGPRRRGALDLVGVEAEAVLLDVDEARDRALVQEAVRGRDEAERRRDDLVAGADLQGADAHVQPGRAAGAGDAVAAPGDRGDARLESRP